MKRMKRMKSIGGVVQYETLFYNTKLFGAFSGIFFSNCLQGAFCSARIKANRRVSNVREVSRDGMLPGNEKNGLGRPLRCIAASATTPSKKSFLN